MKIIKELIPYVVIIIVIICIRSFLITPIVVEGSSMVPTLDGHEVMILKKFDQDYKRFDIVVVDKSFEGDNLIKRVIGMPGETIEYKSNKLYINDEVVSDPYAYGITKDFEKIKLGKNEYFLMGDNREISLDSRLLGPVKKNKIEGTTSFILYPFKKFGNVK